MSRFDYVKYDELATKAQASFKEECRVLEAMISQVITAPRAKAVALTKLEEVYMWIGKGLRDDQIVRNGFVELQEQRTNG